MQLGELAKKVGKEKEAGTTVKIVTPKTDAEQKQEQARLKEQARLQSIRDAQAKHEASLKGLQAASKRK